MKNKWDYGGSYKKYNMDGEIKVGTGILKVHDIFEPIPDFMKNADAFFCDPPCSRGNLTSFYTKADKVNDHEYIDFRKRFFEVLKEINPRIAFIEVFKSNYDSFSKEITMIYKNVIFIDSMYYNQKKNKCWILSASNEKLPDDILTLPLMDEEKIIQLICQSVDFECIADPCMGRGLVGYYADMYGRKFVGTELNKKRLAVCIERIKQKNFKKVIDFC